MKRRYKVATYRTFVRDKEKYYLPEKKQLGKLISNHKEKYDKELKELELKTRYYHKQKKHVPMKPKQGLTENIFNIFSRRLKTFGNIC